MKDMDEKKLQFILKNTYKLYGLLVQVKVGKGEMLSPIKAGKMLQQECELFNKELVSDGKYHLYTDEGFYFYGVCVGEKKMIVGPFSYEKKSSHKNNIYLKKYNIHAGALLIPAMNNSKIQDIIMFVHGLLFDEYNLKENDIFYCNDTENSFEMKEKLVKSMVNYVDNGMQHFSYAREKEYFEVLINSLALADKYESGYPPVNVNDDYMDIKNGAGVLSSSIYKDAEYNFVCCVTLASRYAMKAGADETSVYNLSDVMLRDLSNAKDINEITKLNQKFWKELQELLKKGHKNDESPHIEKVKNYIAKNCFKSIRLEELANYIGVSESYLSRIFSAETGITISEYIKKQKIKRSCNLLKYSDKNITEIADYVSMGPQSYFSKVFKEEMGFTPSSYRKNYRDENF